MASVSTAKHRQDLRCREPEACRALGEWGLRALGGTNQAGLGGMCFTKRAWCYGDVEQRASTGVKNLF